MTKWGLAILSTIVVGGMSYGLNLRSAGKPQVTLSEPLTVVAKGIVPVESVTTTRYYTGEVVATRRSELGFERSGKVTSIKFDRGELVRQGEVIAELDTANLQAQRQQLEAERARAQAQLTELNNGPRSEVIAAAKSQVSDLTNRLQLEDLRRERRQVLYREGAIAQEQLEEVAFNRDALADRLAAAQSQLAELENGTRSEQITAQKALVDQINARIRDIEVTIAKSQLRAPFTGIVGERFIDEGTVVQPGQGILRLVENLPEIEIGLPPHQAATFRPGSQHRVQIGNNTFLARVVALKPETNPLTRTRTIVLELPQQSLYPAPGEIARLVVEQNLAMSGFWLPTAALIKGDRGLWACFALLPQGETYVVEKRDVEVLHTEADRVLVRGTLMPGDVIVQDGVQRLVVGQVVRRA